MAVNGGRRGFQTQVELGDYQYSFDNIRFERDEQGILLVTLHTDGGPIIWGAQAHDEVSACWEAVARDEGNRVVIVTGSGDEFIQSLDLTQDEVATAEGWAHVHTAGKRMLMSHLDVEVPMIAAVNGHATLHSEQALLCDIVIAADMAEWAEPHFALGLPPGDGSQYVWNMVAGYNRGRYLMLTGQRISSATAHEYGMVAEVLPQGQVLDRAYELARMLAEKPYMLLRTTRMLLTHELKRDLHDILGYGIMAEGLVAVSQRPFDQKVDPAVITTVRSQD